MSNQSVPHDNIIADSNSHLLSDVFYSLYQFIRLRALCLKLILKLEKGKFYSNTLRKILKKYHGVTVGRYSYGTCLTPDALPHGTIIGNYCSFAAGLRVFRRNHPRDRVSQHPFFYNSALGIVGADTINSDIDNPLIIENDVWIGEGVTILPGCKKIGNGAIIGAGAVVVKDVISFAIVVGNPGTIKKSRFSEKIQQILIVSKWWKMPINRLLPILEYFTETLTEDKAEEILKYCKKISSEQNDDIS